LRVALLGQRILGWQHVPAVYNDIECQRFVSGRLHWYRIPLGDDELLCWYDDLRKLGLFRLHAVVHYVVDDRVWLLPVRLQRHSLSHRNDELVLRVDQLRKLGLFKLQFVDS
jgi:hypothetical protein